MYGFNLVTRYQRPFLRQFRFQSTYIRTFQPNDIVILRPAKDYTHEGYLVNGLKAEKSTHLNAGGIKHADIIGKRDRQTVPTNKGTEYRIFEPSLAEYVRLTKRLVTPLYPGTTNQIIGLVDLHPPYEGDTVEILEAGTGHGALTLHLAQAIHNFNPPVPEASPEKQESGDAPSTDNDELTKWKGSRKAIIHTVDISAKHSKHATKIVRGFRRGIYAGDVDFHVGDLPDFFSSQSNNRKQYLSHVILDMPSPEDRLGLVCEHLKDDGRLLIFNPSVTQMVDCVERITLDGLPLHLERVVEMAGVFAGPRDWDIRIAKIKNPQLLKTEDEQPVVERQPGFLGRLSKAMSRWLSPKPASAPDTGKLRNYAFICRPKAGDRVAVGGFVGVWRRKRDDE